MNVKYLSMFEITDKKFFLADFLCEGNFCGIVLAAPLVTSIAGLIFGNVHGIIETITWNGETAYDSKMSTLIKKSRIASAKREIFTPCFYKRSALGTIAQYVFC